MYFRLILTFLLSIFVFDINWVDSQATTKLHNAIVAIKGKSGVSGSVRFRENGEGKIDIRGSIEGLVKGPHGMHVHQYGDLSGGCQGAGGHFDAHKNQTEHAGGHGRGHTGDFGNIIAGDTGVANIFINDSFVQLHGDYSVIGRALLIHAHQDDLGKGHNNQSHLTGNVGDSIACGIIAWDN